MAEDTVVQGEVVEAPAKMEFRLINPVEGKFLKRIEWNKDELEKAVRAKVAEYIGIVYTEETIKSAKKDRAELNKLVKAIDERRKKVKDAINAPYATFEKELNEVTNLITEQSAEIDRQVKSFEEKQKEEKKAKIREAYDEAIGDLAEILPFEKVFDTRYLNQTYKLNTAVSEVQEKIKKVKADLETISSVCGKYALNAKDVYVRTLDISKALAEEKRLKELEEKLEAERIRKEKEAEERRKAEEARKAQAEAARREYMIAKQREEERQKAEAEARRKAEEEAAAEKQREEPLEPKTEVSGSNGTEPQTEMGRAIEDIQREAFAQAMNEPVARKVRAKFYAIGTKEQLKALTQYMKDNGIKYGKVE